jgi:hypothetical protein
MNSKSMMPFRSTVSRRRFVTSLVPAFFALPALAQDRYPSRTIKLVVAFAPGGVADIMGRLVAQLLQHKLGGTVIVENKMALSAWARSCAQLRMATHCWSAVSAARLCRR